MCMLILLVLLWITTYSRDSRYRDHQLLHTRTKHLTLTTTQLYLSNPPSFLSHFALRYSPHRTRQTDSYSFFVSLLSVHSTSNQHLMYMQTYQTSRSLFLSDPTDHIRGNYTRHQYTPPLIPPRRNPSTEQLSPSGESGLESRLCGWSKPHLG